MIPFRVVADPGAPDEYRIECWIGTCTHQELLTLTTSPDAVWADHAVRAHPRLVAGDPAAATPLG